MSKKKKKTPGVSPAVSYLDWAANVFVHRDWEISSDHHIEAVFYDKKHYHFQSLQYRFKQGFKFLTKTKKHGVIFKMTLRERVSMFFYCLKRDRNLPDVSLDDGNVIAYWRETGEYLQLMQPSVGSLVVNFLKEEPDHPHAKLIIAEVTRLYDEYIATDEKEE